MMYTVRMDIRWIAGFFDGEGCVYILPRYKKGKWNRAPQLMVAISQKRDGVLRDIQELYGGTVQKSNHCSSLRIAAAKAATFLRSIRPYTRVKSDAIDLGLEFYDWRGTERRPVARGCHGGRPYSDEDERIAQEFHDRLSRLNAPWRW